MSNERGSIGGDRADSRRTATSPDRRLLPRGGRRTTDLDGRHPPVLVADSDDGARRVFVRGLNRFGFEVLEAATGEEALALVTALSPQVVIAELTLPRDDAFQAHVKAHGIPHIVTVTTDEGIVPPDAVVVLEKPFGLSSLVSEVRRALRAGGSPAPA
jgi:CheY-like chemotaxis protein